MVRINDVTKNGEKLIVVWEDEFGNYITYFEPTVTPQEIRVKLSQLSSGFEIPKAISNLIGDEF